MALYLASSERLYLLREKLCTPKLYLPKSSLVVPCVGSPMDDIVKILLCEDRDVELGARTSKHILVFAFDPLSLTLSYIMHCIILSIHIYLIVCHTCVKPRELCIAPQLLFRGI